MATIHIVPSSRSNSRATSVRVSTTGSRCGRFGADNVVDPSRIAAEHVAVEEQERGQGLILRRGADAVLHRERIEELSNVDRAHRCRMALAVEHDEASDPTDAGLLGAGTVVTDAHRIAHPVEQAPRARRRRNGTGDLTRWNGHEPSCVSGSHAIWAVPASPPPA
jgi:hypothetical protein